MWVLLLWMGCGMTAEVRTLQRVDEAFCGLASGCWELYDTEAVCLADNALAQQQCAGAPEGVMAHCADQLAAMAEACVPLAEFAYPAECSAFCVP